jgi:hypothetical protein
MEGKDGGALAKLLAGFTSHCVVTKGGQVWDEESLYGSAGFC